MLAPDLLAFALTMIVAPPQPSPEAAAQPAAKIAPVQRDQRFADFARGVLKCYRPSAAFQGAAIEQRPWSKQKQYGAKGSALLSIDYVGVSNAHYTLFVGVLAKPSAVKAVVDSDTAVVKAYESCELADWVEVK
jgi:hypothetical protein